MLRTCWKLSRKLHTQDLLAEVSVLAGHAAAGSLAICQADRQVLTTGTAKHRQITAGNVEALKLHNAGHGGVCDDHC